MIRIDIPQVAYKTILIEYRVFNEDGSRNIWLEQEFERDLEKSLSDYRYSEAHDHVR